MDLMEKHSDVPIYTYTLNEINLVTNWVTKSLSDLYNQSRIINNNSYTQEGEYL